MYVNREQPERTRCGKLRKSVEKDNGIASARQRYGEPPFMADVRIDGSRDARENRRDSRFSARENESRHRVRSRPTGMLQVANRG